MKVQEKPRIQKRNLAILHTGSLQRKKKFKETYKNLYFQVMSMFTKKKSPVNMVEQGFQFKG